ncbi:MAG: BTAD domain-containing putative transcriptional regulator [Betaproteobacteria bacterium]
MNLTKFLPPKPFHVLVRERLMSMLKSWEDKKLVIIHAQAGQGKSTLAAEYVSSLRSQSVWYNIDREDDNPAVFLSMLGQAVCRMFPKRDVKPPAVPANRFGIGGIQHGVTRWIEQIFEGISTPLCIVFDDYHYISSSLEFRALLKTLFEYTPPNIRFILISRSHPDIGLARLRANHAVGEVTGRELKFSDKETHELFNSIFGLPLPEKESAAINQMTEGWPAGLVLAYEYLTTAPETNRNTALFSQHPDGFRAHIFDYLAQEVFSVLPRDVQSFLLRTSIADYLPVPLIEDMVGLAGTKQEIATAVGTYIQDLRKRNLFVTTIDDAASVIRYHSLFREFLQRKLIAQSDPTEVRRLYSTAANYFKSAGDTVRMVDLLISSGQFDRAVKTIEVNGLELIAKGQIQTLLRWIQALPLDISSRPWFLLYRAIAFRFSEPRTALNFFDLALAGFSSARSMRDGTLGRMLSLCGIIEASFFTGGNFKRMERAAASASALLKRQHRASLAIQARLALAIGTAFFFIGRLRQGDDYLRRALELFRRTGDHFYQIQSAIYLAPCSIYHGDFAGSRAAIRRGFEALKSIPHETGGEAALHMAQAMTALFEGRFGEAEESINRCFGLAHKHDLEAFNFLSLDIGGWLKTAMGDYDAAESLLRQCREKGEERENAFFTASSAHLLAVNYLHQHKIDRAEAEADYALSVRARSGSRLFYAVSLAVSGAIDLKRERLARAERRLLRARRLFQQCDAPQQEANVLLALAELNLKKKKDRQVRQFLEAGLRRGEDLGFTHYYLFSPADLAALLREALARGIRSDFCTAMLDAYGQTATSPSLKIFCLGGFAVYRGGEPIKDAEWKGKRAKNLVKMLAAYQGQKCPRDVISDALWGEASPDAQRANLASLIYRVRKTLDASGDSRDAESHIMVSDDHLSLDPSRVWIDAGQFLLHLDRAERLKKAGDPARSIDEYEKAFKLYRGDFLPDDLYNEWTVAARDRLRSRYMGAMHNMAKIAESAGEKAKAVEAYGRLFQTDECNEDACRWLMTHYLSRGNKNDALRIYERCQLALRRSLDAKPEEQTTKLYRSIIGG